MSHIHWVARQNKQEIPNDEEEVNTREIHKFVHKCDGQGIHVIFIIRVKRELKRVYGNGCRYNERLKAEAGGS
jgi:hypothetical protein